MKRNEKKKKKRRNTVVVAAASQASKSSVLGANRKFPLCDMLSRKDAGGNAVDLSFPLSTM